jgi:hypothetical protein
MLSITVKPLIDPTFGNAVCSPVKVAVSFSNLTPTRRNPGDGCVDRART